LSYLTLSITKDRGGGALLRFIVDFKTRQIDLQRALVACLCRSSGVELAAARLVLR
jgi:hypothetical protein